MDTTNVDSTLYACPSCYAKPFTTTKSNFLRYLTMAEHRQYKTNAKQAVHLHSNGYVMSKKGEWERGIHLPLSDSILILEKIKGNNISVKNHWDNKKGSIVSHPGCRRCQTKFPKEKTHSFRDCENKLYDNTSGGRHGHLLGSHLCQKFI